MPSRTLSLIILLTALLVTGCSLHAVAGDYRLNASITRDGDALPLPERTPTAEYMTPVMLPTNTPTPSVCVVVAIGGLNVRNNPGGAVIGSVANGAFVVVFERRDPWLRIQRGWVHGDYVVCSE